jgi:phage gp36-like protein
MAYAAQTDLVPLRITQTELTQLTVDVPSGNPATDAAVTASIASAVLEEASGTVDSYCRARYVTPLQPSDMVTARTLDIAVYLLFSRRRGGLQPTELVRQRYEDAIAFLKDVAACKASLDQPATQQTPQGSTAGPQISDRDHHLRFKDHHIEGFV